MNAFRAPYHLMADFVAPAAGRAEVWRTALGLISAVVAGFLALQVVLVGMVVSIGPERAQVVALDMAQGTSPAGVVALLYIYLPVILGLALTLRLLMRRGLATLIGPMGPAIRSFLWVGLPLAALWLMLLPLTTLTEGVRPHLTVWQQAPWLPLALVGLVLQTGAEELFFRGYLQQQLAARFRSPWVWMVLPSALFGLSHYSATQYGGVAVLVVIWSAVFGLVAADLTARTGNLGAAVGLHFANNLSAILLVGLDGTLGGLALYTLPFDPGNAGGALVYFAIDSLTLLIGWLVARLILRV
jgi:uncharacterized protein